jgi:hypothetical protein
MDAGGLDALASAGQGIEAGEVACRRAAVTTETLATIVCRASRSGATIGELTDDPDLRAVVQRAVDRANAGVSRPETIKRFRILPGQFQVGAELTPTGKVRRDYVLAKYAVDIDALYAGGNSGRAAAGRTLVPGRCAVKRPILPQEHPSERRCHG